MMHNFKELKVWQKSIELAVDIYKLTESFPSEEKFGMTSQIRRSAVSVSSNIAEGSGRKTNKDFSNFLSHSLGSLFELETQLIISHRIDYLNKDDFDKINKDINEIQKMTFALISKFSTENKS